MSGTKTRAVRAVAAIALAVTCFVGAAGTASALELRVRLLGGGGGLGQPVTPPPTSHTAYCSHPEVAGGRAGSMQVNAADIATFRNFDGLIASGQTSAGFQIKGATMSWGDGTSSPASVSQSGSTFTVSGAHTFATGGTKDASLTVSGTANQTNQQVGLNVFENAVATCNVGMVIKVTTGVVGEAVSFSTPAGPEFTQTVARFTDDGPALASSYSATIVWSDGTSSIGAIESATSARPDRPAFAVKGTHIYGAAGTYPVGVTVIDANHGSTFIGSTAIVFQGG